LQAGGQRFDPVQLHQTLIHCFQIASRLLNRKPLAFRSEDQREPIWKQKGLLIDLSVKAGQKVSYRLRAGRSQKDESV
jgi:hypothetical protein